MKKVIVLTSLVSFLFSCSPKHYDYSAMSVPEEGGIKFVQYTRDDEVVIGPSVKVNSTTKQLVWYASPFIAVSPDGEMIAYVARVNQLNNLYIKNIKGGRTTMQRSFNRYVMDMSFSPDSKKIAFTEKRQNVHNINQINSTQGAAVQQIAASNRDEMGPSYSVDGKEIFYTREEGNRFYIWSFHTETSLVTQYGEGFTPVMTPDGEHMIITRNSRTGFRGEIWSINLKTGMETLILSDPIKGYSSPSISSDNKTIACVGVTQKSAGYPQNLDIYTVQIDGTKLTQLTFHGGYDVSPQWTPGGKSLFFISQRGNSNGEYNVWKMEQR